MSVLGHNREVGQRWQEVAVAHPRLSYEQHLDGLYACITGVEALPPFLMSLFSADDHWMFIGSNGTLTCGRQTADLALFPYCPSDVLLAGVGLAGPQTMLWVQGPQEDAFWEPFATHEQQFEVVRVLRKNLYGSRIQFEEENRTLGLRFSYEWAMSQKYGFVRSSTIENCGGDQVRVAICDGLSNILPTGVGQDFQRRYSNLADAYKLSQQVPGLDLAFFSLNSQPCDRPEPSESLRSSAAWSFGVTGGTTLVTRRQLGAFRSRQPVRSEPLARGVPGCFFKVWEVDFRAQETVHWGIVADVNLDTAAACDLRDELRDAGDRGAAVVADCRRTDDELRGYVAAVDGLTAGPNDLQMHRHLSNSLLNIMRGGMPISGYDVPVDRFAEHLWQRNKSCAARHADLLQQMGSLCNRAEFVDRCRAVEDPDLARIATEYLPFTLSRRHGDPSRPWNSFRIPARSVSGLPEVGYEGNWRDLFQNWEALAVSHPAFLQAMVLRFLNASTVDGHNPYRITTHGVDWERPDPEDPWATIGYWGDHQIIYLYRLFSRYKEVFPDAWAEDLRSRRCVYTDVPYRLRDYDEMLRNASDTVVFDRERDRVLEQAIGAEGTDAVLSKDRSGDVHRVTAFEKVLLAALVKIANFIPDAGIWLNTQRPEWNDALNAIVGKSASVVTACHLKLFLECLQDLVQSSEKDSWALSREVAELFQAIRDVFLRQSRDWREPRCPIVRRMVLDSLQRSVVSYRQAVYAGWSGEFAEVSRSELGELLEAVLTKLRQTIRNNRRDDGLYNTYNWLRFSGNAIATEPVDLMLEGQVAVIESGMLAPEEVVNLLESLRQSPLYRDDQQSYLLYPNRTTTSFLDKNKLPCVTGHRAELVEKICRTGEQNVLRRSRGGDVHFAGHLRNAADLSWEIDRLHNASGQRAISAEDRETLLDLWEEVFEHRAFTGRATTFFGYEGLGSIYWHMVSKLVLALARYIGEMKDGDPNTRQHLVKAFHKLNGGIWRRKSVECYGGFLSDAYSHTPAHAGAQQPGMTGQVKEDILVRFCEYGVSVADGRICFSTPFLRGEEYNQVTSDFHFLDVSGHEVTLTLGPGSFAFTFCQVPIVFVLGSQGRGLRVTSRNGEVVVRNRMELTPAESAAIFNRTGEILRIDVGVDPPKEA